MPIGRGRFLVEKFANENIMFYKHDEITEAKLYGSSQLFMASVGMALSVSKGNSLEILVLGYPRTGKSVLPGALAYQLNKKYGQKYSLVTVDCDECAGTEYEKDLNKALRLSEKNLPSILAFDEYEGCAPPISRIAPETPAALQSRRVRRYAGEKERKPQSLLLAISNYPDIIELSASGNFDSVLYFKPTDKETVAEIIKATLGRDDAYAIGNLLIESRVSLGFATLGHNVLKACDWLAKSKESLKQKSTEEVAKILGCVCGPGATLKQIEEYEEKYKEWIEYANNCQEYYQQLAKEYIDELEAKKNR
jgi:hypothetical protein